ncbi:MAG TPA: SsrA-binding protein SmpB [Candidatus Paceibacterota bacterium]|nr:SsrA-binding protein SmpB [Candidatus Paceibacterota bacterium]
MSSIATNRKARYDYKVLEEFEAGIELKGFEVKSLLTRGVSLKGTYAVIRGGEAWVLNLDIPAYQPKNAPKEYDSERSRKLLLKKKEIKYLMGRTQEKGLTVVPLSMYTKGGKIKVKIGLCKPKKKKDKREKIKKRDIERDVKRHLKNR